MEGKDHVEVNSQAHPPFPQLTTMNYSAHHTGSLVTCLYTGRVVRQVFLVNTFIPFPLQLRSHGRIPRRGEHTMCVNEGA